ncbi:hypothetical protein ACH4MU_31075 [Streptomyces albidoflavus]
MATPHTLRISTWHLVAVPESVLPGIGIARPHLIRVLGAAREAMPNATEITQITMSAGFTIRTSSLWKGASRFTQNSASQCTHDACFTHIGGAVSIGAFGDGANGAAGSHAADQWASRYHHGGRTYCRTKNGTRKLRRSEESGRVDAVNGVAFGVQMGAWLVNRPMLGS